MNQQELINNMKELKNLTESGYNPIQKLRQNQASTANNIQAHDFKRSMQNNESFNTANCQSIPIRVPHHQAHQGDSVLNQIG